MSDDKKIKNDQVEENKQQETVEENNVENKEEVDMENSSQDVKNDNEDVIEKQRKDIEKIKGELEETKNTLLRLRAEYENYRKRTIKEKEGIYSDAYIDVLKEILPVMDNLERAVASEGSLEDLKKGVEMTMKGCQDAFNKLGVQEIDASGQFDPNLHNAVMHIDDENLDKNVIAEVFQKGYKKEDKVIRYTMVKVAN